MKYFQIRVSEYSCLDTVLDQISKEVWQKVKDFLPPEKSSQDLQIRFDAVIKSKVCEYVHEYPNCGLADECHDDIEGGPWIDHNDKIYLMSLSDGFEGFINDVSNEVLDAVVGEVLFDRRSELSSLISATLSHQLSKYLYFNPSCRSIPFCGLQL